MFHEAGAGNEGGLRISSRGRKEKVGLMKCRCGACGTCRGEGEGEQYCGKVKGNRGVTMDGAFAEYMVVSESWKCSVLSFLLVFSLHQ